jgi:hypothetical protein
VALHKAAAAAAAAGSGCGCSSGKLGTATQRKEPNLAEDSASKQGCP